MNKILICTSNRSEYTVLEPLISELNSHEEIQVTIYVTGSHLDSTRGNSLTEIVDRFTNLVIKKIDVDETSIQHQCQIISQIVQNLGLYLETYPQNSILVLGDRIETFAFTTAANLLNTKVIHFSGGDTSLGSRDNQFRDLISLQSSYHFPKILRHREKLISLGIKPEHITVSGYLAGLTIKNRLASSVPLPKSLQNLLKIKSEFLMVTFHPCEKTNDSDVRPLLTALSKFERRFGFLFTAANSDPGGRDINNQIIDFCKMNNGSIYIPQLGRDLFLKVANMATAVIGNSSAGILETKFINKPTLDIMPRQAGRDLNENVIPVANKAEDISGGIETVTSSRFLKSVIENSENIYEPKAVQMIVKKILSYVNH